MGCLCIYIIFRHKMSGNFSALSGGNSSVEYFDLTCWEKALNEAENRTNPSFLDPIQAALLTFLFASGLALNGFAFFLVARFKALRRRDFVLALQVLMADLLLVCYLPVVIATRFVGSAAVEGAIGCSILGFFGVLFNVIRYGAMFVLAFDRFNTVFFPFAYSARANLMAVVLSASLWSFGIVYSVIPAVVNCYGMGPSTGRCTIYPACSKKCAIIRNFFYAVVIALGVVLPTVMYSVMFWKGRRLSKPIATGSLAMPPSVDSTHHRARVTFFILFLTLCGCILPIYLGFALLPIQNTHPKVYWGYAGLSLSFLDCVVVLDPITIMRNKDVTDKIKELWRSIKCAAS